MDRRAMVVALTHGEEVTTMLARFLSSVRSYFRRRIDWTGALTGQRQPQHYPSKRAEQLDRPERFECLAHINRHAPP